MIILLGAVRRYKNELTAFGTSLVQILGQNEPSPIKGGGVVGEYEWKVQVACVYGGAGISEQIAELKRGVEVVVCTPGRMIDMLAANNGRVTNLRRITYLVLDEADRMFDLGFEPQVMRILENIRPDKQTVLFSATFPLKMEALARKILSKPIEIQVGGKSIVCSDVEQCVEIIEPEDKFLRLLQLLGQYSEMGNALVFVEKQEKADELVGDLMKAGYNCAPLHGGIDQYDRESTIVDFKAARFNLLIATSVAARGLDVKKLVLVINYDCPNHYEDYVHRVGRTGRAGNKGWAYTFIHPTGQERMGGEVLKAIVMSNAPIPEPLKKMWEEFVHKMKEDGKEIRMGGGFGGSGYKFDEVEEEQVQDKKNMDRIVMGVAGGANEDDDDLDQTISKLIKSKRREKKGGGPLSNTDKKGKTNEDALEKAKKVAMAIQVGKNIGPGAKAEATSTAEAIMKGETSGGPSVTGKSIAHQLGAILNAKLDYVAEEKEKTEEQEIETVVEEELEINDFPQNETLGLVQEYSDVFISVRGVHVPGNKAPPAGEKKLHLYIESKTELGLNRAKQEIVRVLREELKRLAQQGNRNAPQGRYKVV